VSFDPDVPAEIRPDRNWDHWVIFNIPGSVREIGENSQPQGIAGVGSGGKLVYGGPCPPPQYEPKRHRYFFKLYALDSIIELPQGSSKTRVETAIRGKILASAELIGTYERCS
jgi:Raf kinase inhibitor-like YbhB/YbcL family protein